jgi:plastocyanin
MSRLIAGTLALVAGLVLAAALLGASASGAGKQPPRRAHKTTVAACGHTNAKPRCARLMARQTSGSRTVRWPGAATAAPAAPASPAPAAAPAAEAPAPVATPAPATAPIQVSAREYVLNLSRTIVVPGATIVQFVNLGEDGHDLKLVPAHGAPIAFSETAPGEVRTTTVQLNPGAYTLVCSLFDHAAKGMQARLVVR